MRSILLALVLLAACDDSSAPPASKPDPLAERMRRCPLTVSGARAEIADVDGGVKFTLRGDGQGISEIQRRAAQVADLSAGAAGAGSKAGGGKMRRCPIVTQDTRITVEDLADGAVVTVAAASPEGVTALREESRARLAALVPASL